MRNGKLSELTMQELPTEEKGGSALPTGNWPTPVVSDRNSPTTPYSVAHDIERNILRGVSVEWYKNWPTPASRDWKGFDSAGKKNTHQDPEMYLKVSQTTHRDPQTHPDGSTCSVSCRRLNPLFVEYLMMGKWLIGWTDLKPLGTQSHGRQELSHSDSVSKGQES